jgi:hypothetical protein
MRAVEAGVSPVGPTIAPDTGAATGNLYVIGADASVHTTLANSNEHEERSDLERRRDYL